MELCSEFNDWASHRSLDPSVPFQRMKPIAEWVVDLRPFERVSVINTNLLFPVELHKHRVTGLRIAVKCFPELSSDQEQMFIREIEALARFDHPCIVPFVGYVLRIGSVGPKIATRFMSGGSLRDVLDSHPSWWNGTAKSIVASGVVRGMMKIHEAGIIHRDLKPSNILLDENHRPRICDFGSSRNQSLVQTLTGQIGTPFYMPAEQYHEDYTAKVDVYAFALVLYEIVVGHPVFSRLLTLPQLYHKVMKGDRNEIPNEIDGFVRSLIERGWSQKPESRPSFAEMYEELKQHNFCIAQEGFDAAEVGSYQAWVDRS
jgi:serine/threonine protein kinase